AHHVKVTDLCFADDPLAELTQAIAAFDPEVVGVGLRNLHTNAYDGTEQLIAEYRALVDTIRNLTKAPVVLGGAAYSLQPDTRLTRLGGDYGVVGEAERAFRNLVDNLASGREPPRLTRGAAADAIMRKPLVRKASRWPSSDLDELLPPARDLVDA